VFFLLTTRTSPCCLQRVFKAASPNDLPAAKQKIYTPARKSQVYIKAL